MGIRSMPARYRAALASQREIPPQRALPVRERTVQYFAIIARQAINRKYRTDAALWVYGRFYSAAIESSAA
jgi:hypothetical protein